jgi:hypothetical protein
MAAEKEIRQRLLELEERHTKAKSENEGLKKEAKKIEKRREYHITEMIKAFQQNV